MFVVSGVATAGVISVMASVKVYFGAPAHCPVRRGTLSANTFTVTVVADADATCMKARTSLKNFCEERHAGEEASKRVNKPVDNPSPHDHDAVEGAVQRKS